MRAARRALSLSHWQTWQHKLPEEQQLVNHTLEAVPATLREKKGDIKIRILRKCSGLPALIWDHVGVTLRKEAVKRFGTSVTSPAHFVWQCKYTNRALFDKIYLWEGEPAAGSFVVFIGALELKVLPPNPPQHSSQLLLQLQFPARRKNQVVKSAQRTVELSHIKWNGLWVVAEACVGWCF